MARWEIPRPSRLAPPFIITVLFFLSEQAVTTTAFWKDIPFGWIAVTVLVYWFWLVAEDARNPDSWLRKLLRTWWSFGEFSGPHCRHEYFSLGEDHGGKQKLVCVYVTFTPTKRIWLETIRGQSEIFKYFANSLKEKRGQYDWSDSLNRNSFKQENIDFDLAFIPEDHRHPGVYGDKNVKGYSFGPGTAHFISVEVVSRKRTETINVQILMPMHRPSIGPPKDLDNGGRFVLFQDFEVPKPEFTEQSNLGKTPG